MQTDKTRLVLAVGAIAVLAAALPASAQYFGQNKVQYRDFDFRVLSTEHFDLYYYPEQRDHVEQVARMAERWYARLSTIFDHQLKGRQPLIFYASSPHFQQTNATPGPIGEGTGGFTDAFKRRIVMPSAGSLAETDHVLGHELVHAFQFDLSSKGSSQIPTSLRLPLWFIEGMAEYLAIGPHDPQTAMWMRDALRSEKKLPTLEQLDNPTYFPYRWGHAFWAYVGGRFGDDAVAKLMRTAAQSGDVARAVQEVLAADLKTLSTQWHDALRTTYAPFLNSRKTGSAYGPAIASEKNAGRLNLGPALSPDGKRIAFLSEKDLFSIELFVADAESGKVLKRLSSSATDPHLDSLQFIESSGAWSRDGHRFAYSVVAKGQGAVVVVDSATGKKVSDYALRELDEVFDPAWSPDGRSLAFAAQKAGVLDLFVLDVATGKTRQLTSDAFADMQPDWSPDGRELVFVTDRFSTSLADLSFGNYRLATVSVSGGEIQALPSFETSKNIDPQWSGDGRTIYFVSDTNGSNNVFRLERSTGEIRQITDLVTGVGGITALSPSLTVARDMDRIAFAVREDGRYRIHRMDAPAALAGDPVTYRLVAQGAARPAASDQAPSPDARPDEPPDAGLLPPLERQGQTVAAYREDSMTGLPTGKAPPSAPYKPKLSTDFIGAPTVEVGADRFGGYVGGGVALSFSDMLGDRNVTALLNVNGRIEDVGGRVAYTNFKRKLDWQVGVEHVPYITGGFYFRELGSFQGAPAILDRYYEERQLSTGVFGLVSRPFSRAFRLEAGAGYRRLGQRARLYTDAYLFPTGEFLGSEDETVPGPSALNLFESSAALVYDTSVFGATSPVMGRRFRLEAAPNFGSINFTNLTADFREYLMPKRPFTLALRALHFGRYGGGSEDLRFYDLFLGYPYFVRGYDSSSFGFEDCPPNLGTCPSYEGLFGSRLLVANAELRFPLGALFGAKNLYGPIPVELGLFADAGVAWRAGEKPEFAGGTRELVKSVGVTARINVFGYAVISLDLAKPLDRPQKGWTFQFSFTPGF
jgi:Tol biopolymer transport system component